MKRIFITIIASMLAFSVNAQCSFQMESFVSKRTMCIGDVTDTVVAITTFNTTYTFTGGYPITYTTVTYNGFHNVPVAYIVVTPTTATTTYTITALDTNTGCTAIAIDTITVKHFPLPTITVVSSSPTVCAVGDTVTLTANGATSYSWLSSDFQGSEGIGSVITPYIFDTSSTFYVTGTDTNGCINSASITETIIACSQNGIERYSNNLDFIIYPNPSQGSFTISSAGQSSAQVFNNLGQLVLAKPFIDQTQITNLPIGIYYIKITNDAGIISKKIIITQ